MPPVRAREIFGWCCFDFANSAFTTIIITVVYAPYFMGVVAQGDLRATGWWGTVLSLSLCFVILVSPLIGVVADVLARKKIFLMTTAIACSAATLLLPLAGPGEVWLALCLIFFANVAFSLSEILCSSFLPEISTPKNVGKISGYGWSFGYFGGLFSLLLALAVIKGGGSESVPWSFVMTGLFFLLASLPTLILLRERAVPQPLQPGESVFSKGWAQLRAIPVELPKHRTLAVFFVSMTFYLAGLTAVIAFSSVFAIEVLKMTQSEIIVLFIVLQLAGVAGAFSFGFLQDRIGGKSALVTALILWVIVCVWAALCTSKGEFWAIGVLAGIAMGSLQSAGRAVVSTLTPAGRSGEFFGYWGFFGKLAGVIGQPVFGWLTAVFGFRTAIFANAGFFLIGLLILLPLSLAAPKGE